MPKLLAVLLLIAGVIGLCFALPDLFRQDRVARIFIPVSAQILSSKVPGLKPPSSRFDGTPYDIKIRYDYTVAGQTYESTGIRLQPEKIDAIRPREMLEQYALGATVTAYVDPENPADAILLHTYSSLPYWIAAIAIALAGAGISLFSGIITLPRKEMRTTPIQGTGEFLLLPRQLRRERIRNAAALFVTTAIPAALLAAHMEFILRPTPVGGHVFAEAAAILLIIQALLFASTLSSTRSHSDFRLTVGPVPMRLDAPFKIKAEIDAVKPLHVAEFRARLLCFEHTLLHFGRYTHRAINQHSEKILTLSDQTIISPKQTLSASAQLLLESAQYVPTGQPGISMYPFYRWEIRIELTGDPNYAAVFPLTVLRPTPHS